MKKQADIDNTPPENFIEWVRAVEQAGCVRIEARQLVAGSESGAIAATFEVKDTEDGDERFDAPAMYRRLEEDAEVIGGVQRYTLLAFREGSKAPRERLTLRVDGGGSGDASSSEPANAHGLVAQAHRHNEALLKITATMMSSALETLARQNKQLSEALEKATEEKVELWGIMGELAKHDKDRESHKHELLLKAKQADVMKDALQLAIPGLIGKFLPSAEVKNESLVRLVESLTPEQQASMFGLLTPEQQVALGSFLDDTIKKRNSKEEKANGQS